MTSSILLRSVRAIALKLNKLSQKKVYRHFVTTSGLRCGEGLYGEVALLPYEGLERQDLTKTK